MFKDFLEFPIANEWWVIAAFAWVFVWKGFALWKAARQGAKWWFIALLVINTLGILEILYIYVFSGPRPRPKFEPEKNAPDKKPEHESRPQIAESENK